jgi:hypothetical protein
VEMEPEVTVSFIRAAMLGEIYKPAKCARNRITVYVITGNGLNESVVAAVGGHRVTSDLHKCVSGSQFGPM